MEWEYKTLAVRDKVDTLNAFYADGWEFVNATAENVAISRDSMQNMIGYVFFTIRKKK